jgi:outer membrane protein
MSNLKGRNGQMKSIFYLFIIIPAIYSFNITFAQEKISLKDAITIALNSNTNVVKSTNSIASYQSSVKSAYGNLLPSLNLNGGFGWQRVTDNGGTKQIDYFGNLQTIGPSQVDSRSWSLSAGGSVTLFDGLSNLATISQSKNNLESARLTLEKLKQDVVLQTVNLYTQIISNKRLLDFQQEDLKYNQGLLDRVKQMFDLKMVSISDVYSQEAQTANSKVAYLQAKSNLEKSKINLLTYLSMDASKEYQFDSTSTTISDTSLINSNPENLYAFALNNRHDYQSMKYEVESSNNQLTIAHGGLFPRLSANYGFSSSAVQPSELFNRKIYSLGLSLNVPIFSNWNTENSIQAAEVQVENSNEDLNALELNIKSQVINASLDLQTAKQQLEASGLALTASRESWKIKKETYTLGSATYLDLQQAYNNYLQAEYNKINNEYKYLIAQYTLLNAIGKY